MCFHCLSGVVFVTLNHSCRTRTYTPDAGDHGELLWSGWNGSHYFMHTLRPSILALNASLGIFHLSKIWKAKFTMPCGYLFWRGCREIWNWPFVGVKGSSIITLWFVLRQTCFVSLQFVNFVSDVGGQLGLWIGFSVLTVAEFLELMLLVCGEVAKRCTSTRKTARMWPEQHLKRVL